MWFVTSPGRAERSGNPIWTYTVVVADPVCWRRVKTDHLYRLKIDQAFSDVAYYAAVDKSTRLRWC